MGEESQNDVNAEITTDIFADEAEATAPVGPSPADNKEAPVDQDETKDDAAAAYSEEPADQDEPEGDSAEEVTDKPKVGAEARKEELNREIRELVATRNRARDEVAAENAKFYQAPTAEELVAEGLDPTEARVKALETRTEIAEYTAHVSDLNANLNQQSLQVMAEFPIFDPKSESYNETIATQAQALYREVSGIQTDENTGLVNQINVMPYNIYKTIAETFQASAAEATIKGQKSAEKMLAAADGPSSAAPKAPKSDPLMDLWSN